MTDHRTARFIDRVRFKPEFVPSASMLRSMGLTQDDVVAMRAGTWTAPPSPLEAAVAAALTAQLAPLRDAIAEVTDTLQGLVDVAPEEIDIPAAVQAMAAVTIAISDALG